MLCGHTIDSGQDVPVHLCNCGRRRLAMNVLHETTSLADGDTRIHDRTKRSEYTELKVCTYVKSVYSARSGSVICDGSPPTNTVVHDGSMYGG
jgi:hypothetical protein